MTDNYAKSTAMLPRDHLVLWKVRHEDKIETICTPNGSLQGFCVAHPEAPTPTGLLYIGSPADLPEGVKSTCTRLVEQFTNDPAWRVSISAKELRTRILRHQDSELALREGGKLVWRIVWTSDVLPSDARDLTALAEKGCSPTEILSFLREYAGPFCAEEGGLDHG